MRAFWSRPATAVFLVVLVGVYALEVALGGSTNVGVLIRLGANVPALVLDGQPWRLFTSIFLHIGIVHILLNGWALYQLGGLVETFVGPSRMLAVALGSGLVGSAASTAWHVWMQNPGISAGASGAVFGLLGALVGLLLSRRNDLRAEGRSLLSSLLLWAGLNVYLGLSTPGIDNAAHFGGAITGLLVGYFVLLRRRPQPAV
jgi:rhomboid protease GluP